MELSTMPNSGTASKWLLNKDNINNQVMKALIAEEISQMKSRYFRINTEKSFAWGIEDTEETLLEHPDTIEK